MFIKRLKTSFQSKKGKTELNKKSWKMGRTGTKDTQSVKNKVKD
jgi:hypothetical protein